MNLFIICCQREKKILNVAIEKVGNMVGKLKAVFLGVKHGKWYFNLIGCKRKKILNLVIEKMENVVGILRVCLVIVFVFYFQKLVFGNIKKKQFSCIFEIKNMFG